MVDISETLARLEQPAYTGDNRCLPCTAVNVALAFAIAAGLAIAGSAVAGALAFGVCLALIRLRGYLVPGTPTITRRYFPDRVLERFGKSTAATPTIEAVSPDELASTLTAAGIVTADEGAIRLAPAFRRRWNDRLSSADAADPSAAEVGSMLGADESEQVGETAFLLDGRKQVRWESTAALAADVAAAAELRTRIDGWDALAVDERRDLLTGLRLLRDDCPICRDQVQTAAERLEHCCRRPRIGLRSVCEGCDRPVVERNLAESAADPWLELAGVAVTDEATTEK
ncbi:hypothetical protein [Natrinema versiforme]|uniref:Uncharacterized protein n=1 Tax=Natrinema versiforme JCM 10478 TaxID=1227496 RepID=L9Y8L8_9EURY|nr:hypothetical protein [Natrinema versiforme]ELY70414.1 hypothetical protein C489_02441 [Natrinema versiforme JCM 10478]